MIVSKLPCVDLRKHPLAVQAFFKRLGAKSVLIRGTGDTFWIVKPAMKIASGDKAKRLAKAAGAWSNIPREILQAIARGK